MVQVYNPGQALVKRALRPSYFCFGGGGGLSGSATSCSLKRLTGPLPIDRRVMYAHGERASPWVELSKARLISSIETDSLSAVRLVTKPARKRSLAEV